MMKRADKWPVMANYEIIPQSKFSENNADFLSCFQYVVIGMTAIQLVVGK